MKNIFFGMPSFDFYLSVVIVVFGLLLFATLVNEVLLLKNRANETLKKVRIIIRSWWVIAVTLFLFGALGARGILGLFAVLSLIVITEYFKNSRIGQSKYLIVTFLMIFSLLQTFFIYTHQFEIFNSMPVIFILLTLPFLLFFNSNLEKIPILISSYFGILFTTHCLLFLPSFVFVGEEKFQSIDKAFLCFLLVFGLTQTNDIFQFIFGKLFGKRKVVPQISPNKTEFGFVGGILTTTAVGGICFSQLIGINIFTSLLLGYCIAVFGIFGDLTFSAIKRHLEIKDFGTLLPGHGGLIDRLDSLIFTGPILYVIFKYLLTVGG